MLGLFSLLFDSEYKLSKVFKKQTNIQQLPVLGSSSPLLMRDFKMIKKHNCLQKSNALGHNAFLIAQNPENFENVLGTGIS